MKLLLWLTILAVLTAACVRDLPAPASLPTAAPIQPTAQTLPPSQPTPTKYVPAQGKTLFPSCQLDPNAVQTLVPPEAPAPSAAAAAGKSATLRSLAEQRGLNFGTSVGAGSFNKPAEVELLTRQFNMLAVENAMKWEVIHPEPERYDFSEADQIVAFARANGMSVYAHVLVWENQLSPWLVERAYSRDELIDLLCRHIKTVVGRYRGQVYAWDVVNEAFDPDGTLRNNLWTRGIGPEVIAMAFQWAREADPDALLIYNDVAGEGMNQKSQAIYALAQGLLKLGAPLDGIGMQMHVWLDGPPTQQELSENMQRLADLGLQVHITEMDVRTQYSSLSEAEKLTAQAEFYASAMRACLGASNCTTFVVWGLTDAHSWIPYFYGPDIPLLFDGNYQPKAAYFALLEALTFP
ncbi:MAG: endo-1,4-beta-xylanase [Anaerolineales bacterium]|nr:endo-1,4-beta-xylanase [Anaerolineales bacterium]